MNTQLNTRTILLQAYTYFGYMVQWGKYNTQGYLESKLKYIYYAEALIELIEVFDCGSIGGFGKGQPHSTRPFIRFVWLYKKYVGDPNKLPNFKLINKELCK